MAVRGPAKRAVTSAIIVRPLDDVFFGGRVAGGQVANPFRLPGVAEDFEFLAAGQADSR